MSASEISRIERGAAHRAPIRTLERILEALGARLYVRVQWRGEELDRLLDHDHALIVERMLALLALDGWTAIPEATFQVGGERGSIDILAWHGATGTLPGDRGEVRRSRRPVDGRWSRSEGPHRSDPRAGPWLGRECHRSTARPARRPDRSASDRGLRLDLRAGAPRADRGDQADGWRGRPDLSRACSSCQICLSLTLVSASSRSEARPRTNRAADPDNGHPDHICHGFAANASPANLSEIRARLLIGRDGRVRRRCLGTIEGPAGNASRPRASVRRRG